MMAELNNDALVVREFDEVRHSNELVRKYRTPPGDRLYAYQTDDGDHHVVVSRGSEPGTRWEKRIPATVEHPIPGQKRWTVPDNWEQRVHSKRDSSAYGLFYVPESDVWARVSIPTNNWLTDAWYLVKAVGNLDVEPVGELGKSHEIHRLADEYEESHSADGVAEVAEVIREVASSWDAVNEDLRQTLEWVRGEGLGRIQRNGQPVRVGRDWQIKFHEERVFRPVRAIERAADLSDYDIPLSIVIDELRDADLLPSFNSFELALDDSDIDMKYYVRGLIETGASPAEAVDYYMVEVEGLTQTAWGEDRGVDQSTVSGNVSQAKEELDP